MSTSGTAVFNETIQQIVDGALRKCGQLGEDETSAGSATYTNTAISLNALIKAWQAMGLHVWSEEEAILFLQPGQAQYALGGTTTDNCCDASGYAQTTTAVAAALGAGAITVASAAGLANGQFIGVLLASGAMFWTTVNGAPAGAVVTLTAVLPGAVNAGAVVVAYTTKILRPLRVPRGRLLNLTSGLETPLAEPLSRQEYMDLPNKQAAGVPTQFFYSPKLNSGLLYVWTLPTQAIYALRFTWYRPLYDVTDPAQTIDFPQEWIMPLTWALAEQIAPEFDVAPPRWQMIVSMASAARDTAESWDRESEAVQFGMAWDA